MRRGLCAGSSLLLLLTLMLVGCVISPRLAVNGGTTTTNTEFSLSAAPNPQSVSAGSTVIYTVTVAAENSFTGTVDLTITQASADITASLSNNSITGGTGSVALTVITSVNSTLGNSTVTLSGVDPSNNQSQVITVTATVTQ